MFSNSRRWLPGGRSNEGQDNRVLKLWVSKLASPVRGAHSRHTELPLATSSGPGQGCSFPAQCPIPAVAAEGLGMWGLLESGWGESALQEAQTPHRVSVHRARMSSEASCGTSDALQGFPVSLGSGNTIPIAQGTPSHCSAECPQQPQGAQPEVQGQTHFSFVCLCLGIFKRPGLCSGVSWVP